MYWTAADCDGRLALDARNPVTVRSSLISISAQMHLRGSSRWRAASKRKVRTGLAASSVNDIRQIAASPAARMVRTATGEKDEARPEISAEKCLAAASRKAPGRHRRSGQP